ncbi:hypothetical protein PSN45_001695 [Yamadazyma tenuis]|uniref:Uncharacterized protein n=1 Tax=Candida tenuis (strain ATCC 10573 / BCRC 21748 / CBS 615 / JCM 9827 / NBRC 10315 / NRRL Y-1498 / VKM Y-70) TaxID=590646 RepID=G3BEH2_CANTC|nr:uncharacterized protein CANTEDRAFT_116608 [Yamadazyma tenuis ATCC 10573]XP_006690400.1 uncharacterized protein CANTEDRAFT_116608 [Yamadazyma tenuis ATCC 10573]EGV61185.1 hypothetical protein CANTEDRAFT_116608 [Yamadazyma tenuis ATCC 10573]EGV61186.1 hypothetical protein CANTEDRAFT_116608 [Yamadazyma tenuis ATCC 10573]WEJ94215.1 hypothetical protein PSN45_001695 [Yamadazyma tenuis]
MSSSTQMSFAQTYVLASKVRGKLTKDASNPKVSLRSLVVQANMLDNLMDHIASENSKRLDKLNRVKFELPKTQRQSDTSSPQYTTSIKEYEVSSDSDSDVELDDYDSDSDDYYYSSEEEEEEEDERSYTAVKVDLSTPMKLGTIQEESEVPGLSISDSEESDDEFDGSHFKASPSVIDHHSLFHNNKLHQHHHHRNDAIYSINEVF